MVKRYIFMWEAEEEALAQTEDGMEAETQAVLIEVAVVVLQISDALEIH